MSARVSAIKGTEPIIIVAPHGFDDHFTATIAEHIVKELDCFAVINHGWERHPKFDYFNDKCNCNNLEHLQNDVVKQEFFDPILDFTNLILQRLKSPGMPPFKFPNIFIIHGVSNSVRDKNKNLDLIVGGGKGQLNDSLSAPLWWQNYFMHKCGEKGFTTYEGKPGGNYSGRNYTNLNQLFHAWPKSPNEARFFFPPSVYADAVFSIQIEVVKELRKDEYTAKLTADRLSQAIEDVVETDFDNTPSSKNYPPPPQI